VDDIERRLIEYLQTRMLRYQVQDLRCAKTNRVATNVLACVSEYSAQWELDVSQQESQSELETLHHLADCHQLEELKETTQSILRGFR
jgi:DNA polymerase epsilon subunit 1